MKKLSILALGAILACTLVPANAKTTSSQGMMPTCKGRIVVVNMKAHVYYPATKTHVTSHNMMYMCEAAAKAKGYHMMSKVMVKGAPGKTPPMANPGGQMNAEPGATTNPMNNTNGVKTTVAPKPTPTP